MLGRNYSACTAEKMCPNSVRLVGKRESYASRVEETNEDIQAKIRQRKIPRRHEAARHRDGRKRLKKDATVRREAAEITPALLPHTLFRGPGSYRKRRFCCAPRMRRAEVELSRRYHAAQSRLAKYVSPFIRTKKIVRPRAGAGCRAPAPLTSLTPPASSAPASSARCPLSNLHYLQ
jgi:hypothetical protein